MKLRLPYPPSANEYWKKARGHIIVSDEARAYKRNVKLRAMSEGLKKPLQGEVSLSISVFRPYRRGDLDNRIKILSDALEGIAYEDDDQIVELHAIRYDDKADPRVEVTVEPIHRRNVCPGCDDVSCRSCGGAIR